MALADEMAQWEIHALRNVLSAMLYQARLHLDPTLAGEFTPAGVVLGFELIVDEFERNRLLALRDPAYRRERLRR